MNIEYRITKYFKDNDLLDNTTSNGLIITNNSNELVIKGNSRDLVELADILVCLAKDKTGATHIHLDANTLIDENSEYTELIIEKIRRK